MTVDVTVPENRIKVGVKEGYVTLDGNVDWNFQRVGAEACATRIPGVRGLINHITVKPSASPPEVRTMIENALKRSAEVDSRRISVSATDGTVYLTGSVRSFFERDEAARAAWAAPGVTNVVDHIAVVP